MRLSRALPALLALTGCVLSASAVLSIEEDASQGALVFFRSPPAGEVALGSVVVEVEVVGESFSEVVLLVDGTEEATKKRVKDK